MNYKQKAYLQWMWWWHRLGIITKHVSLLPFLLIVLSKVQNPQSELMELAQPNISFFKNILMSNI